MIKFRHLILLGIAIVCCQSLAAQGRADSSKYESHVYINGTDTLPYRLYRSDKYKAEMRVKLLGDAAQPLVVFLHGAGERGNNNKDQLRLCTRYFLNDTVTKRYSFILLAPQCPKKQRWVNTDWTLPSHIMDKEPTAQMKGVFAIIDSLVKCGVADPNRIYICGISMGGFGVWDAIARRPETFAAAIPICGGGDTNQVAQMKDIPIHIFHGKQDKLVKFSRSMDMYNALTKIESQNLVFTQYDAIGHGCWDQAFSTPGLFEWMFKQVKNGRKD